MAKIALTVLGSSAGMPQPTRLNSGYVLDIADRLIQFDCGGGISSAFLRAGYDPLDTEAVIISHTHPDHISDLPLFVQMQYLAGRKDVLEIYLPSEAVEAVKNYFKALYLLPEKLPFTINFRPVEDTVDIRVGITVVRPIRNSHLEGHRLIIEELGLTHKMQCYSYLIQIEGKTILYSADLGSEKDLLPYLRKLDLLLIESTHIDISYLFQKISEKNIGQIVLTHIDTDFDIDGARSQAAKAGLSDLLIAEDGMRIEL